MTDDLIARLRELGAARHAELTVATEAADEIERLRELLAIARDYVADEIAYLRAAFRGYEELGKVPDAEADLARIDAALENTNV